MCYVRVRYCTCTICRGWTESVGKFPRPWIGTHSPRMESRRCTCSHDKTQQRRLCSDTSAEDMARSVRWRLASARWMAAGCPDYRTSGYFGLGVERQFGFKAWVLKVILSTQENPDNYRCTDELALLTPVQRSFTESGISLQIHLNLTHLHTPLNWSALWIIRTSIRTEVHVPAHLGYVTFPAALIGCGRSVWLCRSMCSLCCKHKPGFTKLVSLLQSLFISTSMIIYSHCVLSVRSRTNP